MKIETKIVLLAAFMAVLSWVAEAASDYYTFRGGQGSFWQLVVSPSSAELYVRTGVLFTFVALGLVASVALGRRKQAEESLKARETLLRQFVENTPTAVAMFDRQMRYLLYSKRWLTDYQLGDRDITGLSHYEVFPDIPERWKQVHQRALAGSVERIDEDEFVRADGHVEWVRWEVQPWLNESGEIGGVVMFTEVITKRKEMELALQGSEERMRRFYRETILSVTDGKLDICGPEEIEPYLRNARLTVDVVAASAISEARHEVEAYLRGAGLPDEQADLMVLGVGEAIDNAIKHAVSARVYAGRNEDSVWVAVSDKGKGIDSLILPRAVLLRGFSTKPSLGLGYCMMLDVADHILLSTGEQGTTVVLMKNLHKAEPRVSLDKIPDTWEAISI